MRSSTLSIVFSYAATAFGLGWLVLILGVLLYDGFSGLSLRVFTEMPPDDGLRRQENEGVFDEPLRPISEIGSAGRRRKNQRPGAQ